MELTTAFIMRAIYALGIGVLIGLERSVGQDPEDETRKRGSADGSAELPPRRGGQDPVAPRTRTRTGSGRT